MEQKNKIIFASLAILLLLQSGNIIYGFAVSYFPVFERLSLALQLGGAGFALATIYYFAAMIGFFMQSPISAASQQFTIASRPFKPDLSIKNPTNHLIASTILLFASLTAIFASQIPGT